MGYLKGKSALMIFDRHANLKYKYGNRHFWCRGYYVDTVGRNKKVIEKYIQNLFEDENALFRWRDIMKDQIEECEYPHQLYILLNKPYRLAFLKYTAEYMSQDDLSEILADVRTSTESPNLDPNLNKRKLVSLFISSNLYMLMTEEKLEVFNSLDEITIYRGVTSYNADNEKALSWTLDYDKAEWFAKRFGEARIVYEAQIEEAHILAYFNRKNESLILNIFLLSKKRKHKLVKLP